MYTEKRPITTYLPFHYHRIPALIRFSIQKIMARKYKNLPDDWYIEQGEQKPLDNIKLPYWKDNKQLSFVLTHDIDTEKGIEHIEKILDIERKLGLKSCVYVPAVLYAKYSEYFNNLVREGFEVGCHGWNHNNKLIYDNNIDIKLREHIMDTFLELPKYGRSLGFRSPSFLRTMKLVRLLALYFYSYDSSIPDIGLFPYKNGCNTIYPFELFNDSGGDLIELPVTMPTDATLLALGYSHKEILESWYDKLDFIESNNGMALLCTHSEPHLSGNYMMLEIYNELLTVLTDVKEYADNIWFVLPHEVASWWRDKINE